MGVNEKMREALERISKLQTSSRYDGENDTIYDAKRIAVEALSQHPVVSEWDSNAYEELRAIIDGGSESMTHSDAVEWCKRHDEADWKPVKTAELTDEELDEIWAKHAMSATFDCVDLLRDTIAAHEAKKRGAA